MAEFNRYSASKIADAFIAIHLAGWRSICRMLDNRFDASDIVDLIHSPVA